MLYPLFFSTITLKYLKQFNTSDFLFRKHMQVFLLKSSESTYYVQLGKTSFVVFAEDTTLTYFFWMINVRHIFDHLLASIFRLVKFRCPSLIYQRHSSLLVMAVKHFVASYWIFNRNILFLDIFIKAINLSLLSLTTI